MKTKQFLAFVLFIGLFASCDKGPFPVPPPVVQNNDIEGDWNLIQATGGLAGATINYQSGEVLWTFDTLNNTILVNNTDTAWYNSLPSGTYNYYDSLSNGVEYLIINNEVYGSMVISNDTLYIGQELIMADGFSLTFVR